MEEEFIESTGYLFDWEECVALMDPESEPDSDWIPKEALTLEEALVLIKLENYTAVPF